MLSLASVPIAAYMQGKAFLGANADKPRSYIFATRDRVDEVIECSRTLHDGRYHYIRNFLPHRPRMQLSSYSEITPIRKELRRLGAEGKLQGDAKWLMTDTKPAEELYDTGTDKFQIKNLAASPEYQAILKQMRKALYARMIELRDTAMLTEDEMHRRCADDPPYDVAQRNGAYDVERIVKAAALVGMGTQHRDKLTTLLGDADSAVRYWAAVGLAALDAEAEPAADALNKALHDSSPSVRIAAAEALCNIGYEKQGLSVLAQDIKVANGFVQVEAASALFAVRKKIGPEHKQIHAALASKPNDRYSADAIRHVAEYLRQRGVIE
jgi:N-sulfoglucosamine sulfohydrolase